MTFYIILYCFMIYFLIGICIVSVNNKHLQAILSKLTREQYIQFLILAGLLWLPILIFGIIELFTSTKFKELYEESKREVEEKENKK